MESTEKSLEYWRKNAEDNYLTTPISVLRYITELEKEINKPIHKDAERPIWLTDEIAESIKKLWNTPNDGTNPRVRALNILRNHSFQSDKIKLPIEEAANLIKKYCI